MTVQGAFSTIGNSKRICLCTGDVRSERMVHRIRTGFGDAKETYGGDDIMDWEFTPQGVLQGNASGPTIWSVFSSVIFEILHDKGFGVEFCSTLSKQLFLLVGF